MYLFLRFLHPSYMTDIIVLARDTYNSMDWERGQEIASTLDTMLEKHLIPTPIQVAMEVLWTGVFSGSLLSILTALLVGATKRPRTRS